MKNWRQFRPLLGFMHVLYPGRIAIRTIGFCGGRKTGETAFRRKTLERGKNQQRTQPTYSCVQKGCPTKYKSVRDNVETYYGYCWPTVAWMKLKEFHHHRRKQQTCVFMPFVNGTLLTSVEEHQTITTHNPNRHCRVHFYACVGQLLSKQLYTPPNRNRTQVTRVGGEHFRHCTIPAPLNATPNDYKWYLSKHQVLTA